MSQEEAAAFVTWIRHLHSRWVEISRGKSISNPKIIHEARCSMALLAHPIPSVTEPKAEKVETCNPFCAERDTAGRRGWEEGRNVDVCSHNKSSFVLKLSAGGFSWDFNDEQRFNFVIIHLSFTWIACCTDKSYNELYMGAFVLIIKSCNYRKNPSNLPPLPFSFLSSNPLTRLRSFPHTQIVELESLLSLSRLDRRPFLLVAVLVVSIVAVVGVVTVVKSVLLLRLLIHFLISLLSLGVVTFKLRWLSFLLTIIWISFTTSMCGMAERCCCCCLDILPTSCGASRGLSILVPDVDEIMVTGKNLSGIKGLLSGDEKKQFG